MTLKLVIADTYTDTKWPFSTHFSIQRQVGSGVVVGHLRHRLHYIRKHRSLDECHCAPVPRSRTPWRAALSQRAKGRSLSKTECISMFKTKTSSRSAEARCWPTSSEWEKVDYSLKLSFHHPWAVPGLHPNLYHVDFQEILVYQTTAVHKHNTQHEGFYYILSLRAKHLISIT